MNANEHDIPDMCDDDSDSNDDACQNGGGEADKFDDASDCGESNGDDEEAGHIAPDDGPDVGDVDVWAEVSSINCRHQVTS